MTFEAGLAVYEESHSYGVSGFASNAVIVHRVANAVSLTKEGYVLATMRKIVAADKAAPVATMSAKEFLKWLDRD